LLRLRRLKDVATRLYTHHQTKVAGHDLLAAGVQHLARGEGDIILGVNEEDRRRDVVNGGQEPRFATPESDQSFS